ncbi:MAG: hypothetical protein K9L60_14645 [Methylovulum sp.]|nr:hypothetical protein [Methylovulum sp.]
MDSLQMSKWNFDELLTAFHELPFSSETYDSDYQKWREANTIRQENLKSWFEQKDDEWLMRFYALLNDAPKQSDWTSLNFRLVRIEADGEIKHVKANNAYFAPLHENISTDGVNIVKRETYVKDNSKQDIDENAEQFLEKIGVKPFDETAALKLLLENRYRKYPKWDSYDYYADIKQIVRYWKENISKSWWKTSEILEIENLFKTEKFLLGTKKDDDGKTTSHWLTASDICLDDSYFETGLAKLTHVHQKSPIWYNYKNKLNENELADFVEFLKFIGVMYKLEVIERFFHSSSANENPNNPHKDKNYNGEGRDYAIPNLVQYIGTKTEIASRIIWNTLINASGTVKTASFKPNRKPEARFDSLLITVLKNRAWILGKDGYLYSPKAITRDDLPDNFPFNNSNGLLTAIEFGKNAKDNEERERRLQEQTNSNFKQRDIFAKELGAESVDEAEEAIKFLHEMKSQGKTLDEIRDILNPKKPYFEDDYSSNPERRTGKIQETTVDAPEKRTEMRQRSVAIDNTETKKAAKSYLRERYTDDDKILYCQICKKEMPFKLSDGSYYFEVVQLIGDTQKRYKENYIALCPTDAAKFQYTNPSKDNISDLVSTLIDDRSPDDINDSDEDENCFDIVLAGNTETVQFRRVHLIDLKAVLS